MQTDEMSGGAQSDRWWFFPFIFFFLFSFVGQFNFFVNNFLRRAVLSGLWQLQSDDVSSDNIWLQFVGTLIKFKKLIDNSYSPCWIGSNHNLMFFWRYFRIKGCFFLPVCMFSLKEKITTEPLVCPSICLCY